MIQKKGKVFFKKCSKLKKNLLLLSLMITTKLQKNKMSKKLTKAINKNIVSFEICYFHEHKVKSSINLAQGLNT